MTDHAAIEAQRTRIRDTYVKADRTASSARGLHHVALLSADVERTVRFYQDHFFFDIGNGNLLAFFDFPGLDLGPYAEVLGGLHHIAISVEPERWERLKANLDAAGVEYQLESGTSIYFRDPDGARLELIADPLGEMYGTAVA
jgi:catechol 2,3-dioxygenase-like lactoylglutathione lyase family enzyme